MRLKLILMLFLAVFVSFVIVGCGNKQTPSQPATPQTQSSKQQPEGQKGEQTQVTPGTATKGKTLFAANCSGCHSTDTTAKKGPGLKGIYSRSKLSNGDPVNDESLTRWMAEGNDKMPGNPALSRQDTADIEAFLKTLK